MGQGFVALEIIFPGDELKTQLFFCAWVCSDFTDIGVINTSKWNNARIIICMLLSFTLFYYDL